MPIQTKRTQGNFTAQKWPESLTDKFLRVCQDYIGYGFFGILRLVYWEGTDCVAPRRFSILVSPFHGRLILVN